MSASKIKKLISEFNYEHDENSYAEIRMFEKGISEEDKQEWEHLADLSEYRMFDIAEKIKKLKPSKYMMEKYSELDYILSFV